MMKRRYEVVKPIQDNIEPCCCSKCGKFKPCAKVMDVKTGQFEWRCRGCVRYLDGKVGKEASHRLADEHLKIMKEKLNKMK